MNRAWNGYNRIGIENRPYKLRTKPTNRLKNYSTPYTSSGVLQSQLQDSKTLDIVAATSEISAALSTADETSATGAPLQELSSAPEPTLTTSHENPALTTSQEEATLNNPQSEPIVALSPDERTASGPSQELIETMANETDQEPAETATAEAEKDNDSEPKTDDGYQGNEDQDKMHDSNEVQITKSEHYESRVETTVVPHSSDVAAHSEILEKFEGEELLAAKNYTQSDLATGEPANQLPLEHAPQNDIAKQDASKSSSTHLAFTKTESKEKIWTSVGICLGVTLGVSLLVALGIIKYLSWKRKRANLREKQEMMAAAMYDSERNAFNYGIGDAHRMF